MGASPLTPDAWAQRVAQRWTAQSSVATPRAGAPVPVHAPARAHPPAQAQLAAAAAETRAAEVSEPDDANVWRAPDTDAGTRDAPADGTAVVEAVAERVYRRLLDELARERERTGTLGR